MSPTSAHNRGVRGFTMTELLVALSLSAIIFAAVFSAYIFLGRNLTRLVNLQGQEVQSRRTLRRFTEDVSAAIALSTATATQVAFTKPISSGTAAITYGYSSANGTLTRTDPSGTQTLLSGVTAFSVTYYNETGTAVTSSPQSVKAIELTFTTAAGSNASGTLASYTSVSPRVVLRNKQALQ
ncbi:MAG: type II secretion system protein [Opitutaceae bacterium]|nr:type II secretion system protein [Opitutaceae bacterium]